MIPKTEILRLAKEGKIIFSKGKSGSVNLSKDQIKELFLRLKKKKAKLSFYRYLVNYPNSPAPKYRIGYSLQGSLEGKKYSLEFKIERGKIVIYSISRV
ncbi:MAG: hypothetical protein J7J30_00665 [Candidatus Odinarchaeota archaeon]|nr:hypothetical protein [Candidatus Odinarchaeota archaeon]